MNSKPSVTVRSVESFEENLNQIESLIRNRAYERFLERGKQDGQDQDDWFNATTDILQQPLMTLSETDTQIAVILSLTGLDISDLEVLATSDALLVRGALRQSSEGTAPRRTILKHVRLARQIDPESVRAEFQNGTFRCTATVEAVHFFQAKTA